MIDSELLMKKLSTLEPDLAYLATCGHSPEYLNGYESGYEAAMDVIRWMLEEMKTDGQHGTQL